jgi:cell division protein FtsN
MADNGKIPGWVWVTTPALALGLLAGLGYLSTVPAEDGVAGVKQDVGKVIKETTQQLRDDTKAVTEAAKPSYDFYRLLEKQTVEVPEVEAYRSTPKDAVARYEYRLQAGSFRSVDDADRLRAELLLEGLPAYLESSTVKASTWHRVFIGPFTDRSKLNKAQDMLAARNISPLVLKQKIDG